MWDGGVIMERSPTTVLSLSEDGGGWRSLGLGGGLTVGARAPCRIGWFNWLVQVQWQTVQTTRTIATTQNHVLLARVLLSIHRTVSIHEA